MRIMFFCYAEEMEFELVGWARYLSKYPHDFVVAPLIRLVDGEKYAHTLHNLSIMATNVSVSPIYVRSKNSSFKNLFFPSVLATDALAIFECLRKVKPDVVVCFYVTHAYPVLFFKPFFGYSMTVYAMGSDVNLENSFVQGFMKKMVYMNSALIFSVSTKMQEKIMAVTGRKIVWVPSSADSLFFKPLDSKVELRRKWSLQSKSHVILTVCRLIKGKGVDVLIEAVKSLGSLDWQLVVVGDGPERLALEGLVARLGLGGKVLFLGFKSKSELLELYNVADVFVLASFSEGLPRVLIEAMDCGCVPVVTDVGDVGLVVRDFFNGFLVTPGDRVSLERKLSDVLSLSEANLRLIQNRARSCAVANNDSRSVVAKIVENLNLLGNGN